MKNEEELLLKEIRVGIIGTGMISHTHMQRYAKIPNAKVVAACDLNQEKIGRLESAIRRGKRLYRLQGAFKERRY